MKELKKIILKLIILFVILVGTIVTYFVVTYEEVQDPATSITTATLPVITMKYQDTDINVLHGYTNEMQGQYMRDAVTPYDGSGIIEFELDRYANVIAGISYEVRSTDTERLIDAREVKEWVTDGESIYVELALSSIMQPEEEYLLVIRLVTETHGNVNYYVRLKNCEEHDLAKQLAYVHDFSQLTIQKEATDKYGANLEYDSSADHTNLAYVDIHSSYSNIDWGNLQVSRASTPVVTIKEFLGMIGCYQLEYKVKAADEYGNEQYYNVTEYFRLRTLGERIYLDVYERHANQIFNPNAQSVSTTRMNLGLDDDMEIHYKTSPTGSFVSFVKEGSLFLLDMKRNKVTEVFSFEKLNEEDVRIDNSGFDIEILSTDAEGNSMFIVYGYMVKGAHEGQVGVALYDYHYEKNIVDELVFVPSDKPFEVFRDSVGKFAYMTKDNLLYFMIGNSIYTVTMDSNEYMQLVTGLTDGNYIINQYNNILAWHESASVYDASSIRIIDVDKEEDYVIQAEEGDRLKVIGFIGNDLVYGVAHATDIYQDAEGNTVFPMYKINVIVYQEKKEEPETETEAESDEETEEPKQPELVMETYQKENVYVTHIDIKENVMSFKRQVKQADGTFVAIEDDKFVNRLGTDKDIVKLDVIATEFKKKEVVLKLAYTITSENPLSVQTVETIEFVTANTLNLNQDEYITDRYYVYAAEGLEGIYSKASEAINHANTGFGVVVENNGNLFWARISKPSLAKLPDTTALVAKGYTSIDMVLQETGYKVTDISGVEFSTLLYYGAQDIPVIVWLPDYGCAILSAYSGYQGNIDTLAFTLCQTGEIIKMPYNDAKAALEAGGSRYVVLEMEK